MMPKRFARQIARLERLNFGSVGAGHIAENDQLPHEQSKHSTFWNQRSKVISFHGVTCDARLFVDAIRPNASRRSTRSVE